MIPESCSFAYNGTQCPLPPQFIIEILDESNNGNKFIIRLTCPDHKKIKKKKFLLLQGNNVIPAGKIVLTPVKIIHTDCVKGTLEDEDEVKLKRMKE